ncbi:MAG: UPF0182 family protein [Planctomycetota bacterium]|nr:UPF0182 family protein [Planctomycetota bacterium]
MYVLLLLAIIAVGLAIGAWGLIRRGWGRVATGCAIILAGILFFSLLGFWSEMLWFEALGYGGRFWTVVWTRVLLFVAGAAASAALVYLLTLPIPRDRRAARIWPEALAGVTGGFWGLGVWQETLLLVNRVPADVREPILHLDASFYLFVLPFLDRAYSLLIWLVLISAAAAVVGSLRRRIVGDEVRWQVRSSRGAGDDPFRPIIIAGAAIALALALSRGLAMFHLLSSEWGVVTGPGWTDVHIRLPVYWIVGIVTLLLGAGTLLSPLRRRIGRPIRGAVQAGSADIFGAATLWVCIAAVWLVGQAIVPGLVQWLAVQPNEITRERPYITHNIEFTRRAFKLDQVEERQFPARDRFDRQTAENNRRLLEEIRLWDWRALDAVYKQFQEIRLYYEFADVDIDRYTIGDRYRQVMVSGRELDQRNLPEQSRTFVNQRFKYTHGYGLTLATVSDFTPDGLPNLLVKDIPPKSEAPALKVDRPEIYYGELARQPVVTNTSEKEFDHPSGDENVYVRYDGRGGVEMRNLWRKFVFGWRFDGTRFLLSGYPRGESRVLFRRTVRRRVKALAPFLRFDADPYLVLADGRLYWIIDAYTTSSRFPYSEPFSSTEIIEYKAGEQTRRMRNTAVSYLDGANYVRNSVKAVVDAYNGSVDFYVFEPGDPIITTWRGVFPGLFKDRADMPEALEKHIRYPEGLLLTQGLVYAKYHMDDPTVFYNQEDLWVRATEKYYNRLQPVEPYYIMWRPPEADETEFVMILPFTPKNRQVLIGWIAGMCDPGNYGRFLAYKFPKEKRVLGPQQVETKIDQDRFLSGQLTLWDQRGSNVIRGNVLAIPVESTLLYVEPIYLQAETAAYPELRLVVLMHGDTLSYAETFDKALEGLLTGGGTRPAALQPPIEDDAAGDLARQARDAFEAYLRLQSEKRFDEAAEALKRLQRLLDRMIEDSGEKTSSEVAE